MRRRLAVLGRAALLVAIGLGAAARDGRAETPDPAVTSDALARAKELFRRGLVLLDAGDFERALEQFERSRALVPGKGNTIDVAICLDHLGRYDEALEAYEDALSRHADQLAPEDRASIAPAIQALQRRIGSLDIATNVDGDVVVDTRARGKLPRTTPLRLLAGAHVVRVLKDGYATCEKRVEIVAGTTLAIECSLAPLAEAGQLRLEDPTNPGASVFVDGALVGATPWEGTLSPGAHLVWIQKEGRGTGPSRAYVVQGQTALVRLVSRPLGPAVTIDVEPQTAELTIDDVPLGAARWRGPLPAGRHRIAASEPGYVARSVTLLEPDARGASRKIVLRLGIDASHPRWPRALGPVVGVFGGPAVGGAVGSGAEARCPAACSGSPHALGFLVGARAGFRFPSGLALELDGGYLRAETSFSRTIESSWGRAPSLHPITYALDDDVTLRGPFVGASLSLRRGKTVALLVRTMVGAWILAATDPITGSAEAGGKTAPVGVSDPSERLTSVAPLVMPELGVDVKLGPVQLGASLALAFVPSAGPGFRHLQIEVTPTCSRADVAAVGCAANSAAVAGEQAYSSILFFLPQLSATAAF